MIVPFILAPSVHTGPHDIFDNNMSTYFFQLWNKYVLLFDILLVDIMEYTYYWHVILKPILANMLFVIIC